MVESYANKPICELKTAWDWLFVLKEWAYEVPHFDEPKDELLDWVKKKSKPSNIEIAKNRRLYEEYWDITEEWVSAAIKDIEGAFLRDDTCSLTQVLLVPPHYPGNMFSDHSIPKDKYRFELCRRFAQQPPDFFLKMIGQNSELKKIFPQFIPSKDGLGNYSNPEGTNITGFEKVASRDWDLYQYCRTHRTLNEIRQFMGYSKKSKAHQAAKKRLKEQGYNLDYDNVTGCYVSQQPSQ